MHYIAFVLHMNFVMQGCSDTQKTVTKLYVPVIERALTRLGATISVILVIVQLTSPVPLSGWDPSLLPPAQAVLYSPDTKVPRTGELALRKAIPANTNMKSIQVHQTACLQIYFHIFNIFYVETFFSYHVEFTRGTVVLAKDTSKKALWNNGE